MRANRVNIVGTITADRSIDDGTASIALKDFENRMAGIREGETAVVIGKVREQDGQRFISVEIAKKVPEEYLKLRKLEWRALQTAREAEETESTQPASERLELDIENIQLD
ncbi:MAG: hypothetical protein JW834_01210 [Candidatus Diapherotrites archaeon]|nr:hypothetical protein [Candidatus Diapherotrites archaeon]